MDPFGPEAVAARLAIRDRLDCYCRGVDRRDGELIKSCFHPDAIDDHGAFLGKSHDFADWIIERLRDMPAYGQHHVTNCLIRFDGPDKARVESYYLAWHPRRDEASGRIVLLHDGGRYLDQFEQRNGEWRISHRKVLVDWSRGELAGEQWEGQAQFPPAGAIGDDPSDALFGPGA